MKRSTNLQILINKLEEQGVLTKHRADMARWLAKGLGGPIGKLITGLLVKVIASIVFDAIDDR